MRSAKRTYRRSPLAQYIAPEKRGVTHSCVPHRDSSRACLDRRNIIQAWRRVLTRHAKCVPPRLAADEAVVGDQNRNGQSAAVGDSDSWRHSYFETLYPAQRAEREAGFPLDPRRLLSTNAHSSRQFSRTRPLDLRCVSQWADRRRIPSIPTSVHGRGFSTQPAVLPVSATKFRIIHSVNEIDIGVARRDQRSSASDP